MHERQGHGERGREKSSHSGIHSHIDLKDDQSIKKGFFTQGRKSAHAGCKLVERSWRKRKGKKERRIRDMIVWAESKSLSHISLVHHHRHAVPVPVSIRKQEGTRKLSFLLIR